MGRRAATFRISMSSVPWSNSASRRVFSSCLVLDWNTSQRRAMPITRRALLQRLSAAAPLSALAADTGWPAFRGPGGRGVADGYPAPTTWNADPAAGPLRAIHWRVPVPGLGHSSPIIWGERIFVPSAVRRSGKAPLRVGPTGGEPTAAKDDD